jgi:hypothetical protein
MNAKRIIISALTTATLCATASATTRQVPSQYSTIQAGINAAVNGDTVLVANGTYTGAGNKNLDYGGRAIVVRSSGGPDSCMIDCEWSGRGFDFHTNETSAAVLSGFKIKGGYITGNGGGISISSANPTIQNCAIWYCYGISGYAGGIYVYNGAPAIKKCTFSQNNASYGGALYLVNSNSIIENCIFANNTSG